MLLHLKHIYYHHYLQQREGTKVKTVILYLIMLTGNGGVEHVEYGYYDTDKECRRAGRLLTVQNLNVRGYICHSPEEVQAEYFQHQD